MDSVIELELQWRMHRWEMLKASPNWPDLKSDDIRELNLYSGAAGVYRDAPRTNVLIPDGITVSIRNSGGKYSDEISDNRMFYSYPRTMRRGQDQPEIQSLKNAMFTGLPIFVISDAKGGRRNVQLGWIEGCEDAADGCLVKLDTAPQTLIHPKEIIASPFHAQLKRKLQASEIKRLERDPKFKFNALTLYKSTCAVTDVTVERMLDAAHVIPVAESGSDHPYNSLLLNAAVHRTFDSHFWSIEPDSLRLAVRSVGPTLDEMKIVRKSISHLPEKPHIETLAHRWERFRKSCGDKFEIAS